MTNTIPLDTILALIEARKNKDFEVAFSCYEPDATIVLQPGQTSSGEAAIRAFIEGTSNLTLSFEGHEIIETSNLALHLSRYTLDIGDTGTTTGRTAGVLRLQADGSWRIIIDNGWVDHE